jgi:cyanate permease
VLAPDRRLFVGAAIVLLALNLRVAVGSVCVVLDALRVSRAPDGTAALSGFAQSIGYVIAGLGPLGTGLLHDATGTWTVPVAVLLVSAILIGVFGTVVNRERFLEDELGR